MLERLGHLQQECLTSCPFCPLQRAATSDRNSLVPRAWWSGLEQFLTVASHRVSVSCKTLGLSLLRRRFRALAAWLGPSGRWLICTSNIKYQISRGSKEQQHKKPGVLVRDVSHLMAWSQRSIILRIIGIFIAAVFYSFARVTGWGYYYSYNWGITILYIWVNIEHMYDRQSHPPCSYSCIIPLLLYYYTIIVQLMC